MPALSPTMTQGNIGQWAKKEGDAIAPGDVLVEIETDKAQMDFEFQEEGYIAKILVQPGTKDLAVNSPIAILVESEDLVAQFADFTVNDIQGGSTAATSEAQAEPAKTEAAPAPKAESKPAATESKPQATSTQSSSDDRIKASPLARKLAEEKGIDIGAVVGSGPGGRIVKSDIENYKPSAAPAASQASTPAAAAPAPAPAGASFTDIPLSNMRKVIASRLSESKQTIPHYYLTSEINMDKVLKLRAALNASGKDQYKISVNDFVVKASSIALKAVPEVNSSWQGEFIRQYHNTDISIAAATPAGLITPIVRNVEAKGLAGISAEVKELATKARNNELKPHEYQGGSFTISNLGMYGVNSFTAIINPPQSCILAVGGTEKKLVLNPNTEKGFSESNVMKVTLSCDHRVVDGAVGAQWLKKFKELLENPLNMLL
ncbi:pyruvate dehydrogenase [Conidiobolus coronatus NRRL 28638]|uniref:Acetyltransferase component of pyruvate dehydrogenase complex n=1 Tax=Conidiobolus coronatus (strain ATCC 28846 / CBS 209.66 / NRRL 28638) TaxID=796925 RepID=A0A137PEY5_CONC2|nr:pyruvate dehydrogenase [Conidiobolus coronatus NRRL 28638]|eukprot:KXN73550.1 pyruvate dehydrogenase [Conidiobolus coronatus NRRL 28638]